MIVRRLETQLRALLEEYLAVALLGPRQVGKTTLALEIAQAADSVYLDLESPSDRARLSDAELYLSDHEDRLVILDEVHRVPDLFQSLRGLIDRGRRRGRLAGRFLLLGSASMDLLRQSGETLAGRIAYIELTRSMSWRSTRGTMTPYGCAAVFLTASWRGATVEALPGERISYARTSSATFPSSARGFQPRR